MQCTNRHPVMLAALAAAILSSSGTVLAGPEVPWHKNCDLTGTWHGESTGMFYHTDTEEFSGFDAAMTLIVEDQDGQAFHGTMQFDGDPNVFPVTGVIADDEVYITGSTSTFEAELEKCAEMIGGGHKLPGASNSHGTIAFELSR